jgi:aspartyl-tRNA(Asn)/glutamyl-tRNA(Gln) amidotransferase subunit B
MVTGPDLRSADEAAQYLIRLRQLLRWIGISEADMEKAHLRCDANVSIRPKGADYLNPKTEIKNVNSIVAVRDAIQKEVERQIQETEAGRRIEAWTLEWMRGGHLRRCAPKTEQLRLPQADLLPIRLTPEWKAAILVDLPELPLERRKRFTQQYGLPDYDADILTNERSLSEYFESAIKVYGGDPKRVSNWLMNEVLRMLNDKGITAAELHLTPAYLAETIKLVKGIRSNGEHIDGQGAVREDREQRQGARRDRAGRGAGAGQRRGGDPGSVRRGPGGESGAGGGLQGR